MKNGPCSFLLLFGALYHDGRGRPSQSCVITEISSESTSINLLCKEDTIPDKKCQKDVISGLCVAPPDCALRNVQVKHLDNNSREISWTVAHNGTKTGGYLVEYPLDVAWSDSVCKTVLVNSNIDFQGTFSTAFRITSDLSPTVKPLWKMMNKNDNLRGTNIQNPNATFLKISFEVWTSTSHKYNVELLGSNNKSIQSKTVGKNYAVFSNIKPGLYYAKIRILDDSCDCGCFKSSQCRQYSGWTTGIFQHPATSGDRVSEPKKDHYTLVFLFLVVIFSLILAITGIALLIACEKNMSGKQLTRNYKYGYRDVLLYAAKETNDHVAAVISLQNYLSNVFQCHVNHTFINRQDIYDQKKFLFSWKTLNVIILSRSLKWSLEYIENLPLNQRKRVVFVTLAVDCATLLSPANITIFHIHKDLASFHHFLSNFFLQKQTKQDVTVEENRQRLQTALTDLNTFSSTNIHTSGTFQTKPLVATRPDRSFDSISKILTIYKKRKTYSNKRMFGFQMTSNGSEHIVLPGEITFTDDDTTSAQEEPPTCLDRTEGRSEEKVHGVHLKEGMAQMYRTNTMDEQRSLLLPGGEQRPEDIEAISLGGKSV